MPNKLGSVAIVSMDDEVLYCVAVSGTLEGCLSSKGEAYYHLHDRIGNVVGIVDSTGGSSQHLRI